MATPTTVARARTTTTPRASSWVTVNGVPNSNSVIGASRIRDAQTGIPRNKIILDARYAVFAWSFDVTGTRYSRYRYNVGTVPGVATANGNIDQVFSPETYLDLEADYQALEQLRLAVQVQNVFDKYPGKYVLGNHSSGINPYSFIARTVPRAALSTSW